MKKNGKERGGGCSKAISSTQVSEGWLGEKKRVGMPSQKGKRVKLARKKGKS